MIVVICGPPGVGKTTLAHRVRERLAEAGLPFEILHSDAFARRTYERMYERTRESGDDWILDGTFHEREWVDRFRRLDDLRVVSLRASLATCLRRNRVREDPIDERGVHVVYREFDEPDADLRIDTDEWSIEEAVASVTESVARWYDERTSAR